MRSRSASAAQINLGDGWRQQSDNGTMTATAAGHIEAGQTLQTVDEAHQSRSKGLLSSKTTTKRDTAGKALSQGRTPSMLKVTKIGGE